MLNSLKLKKKIFPMLEGEVHQSLINRIINAVLICLIVTNVIAVIFESDKVINQRFLTEFFIFEIFSVIIFSIEYLTRLWICTELPQFKQYPPLQARLRYMVSPMAVIDLIAILPFFLSLFIALDLRYLRLLRVLRLLKLSHYFKGFNIFLTVISKEIRSIAAAMLMMVFLIIIAASLMYSLENEAQPEAFGNMMQSLWWAVVTMTTIGYGDVTPITTLGKMVATVIMLIGVGLVALPAGMLAARFGDELRERKRNLNAHIINALADGKIDSIELSALQELADKLELRPDDLERNIALLKTTNLNVKCPYCGK
ncbi:MAG: voltage-gated potassium channel [Gammaproteobacteria bacterium]|jgi:voltage-gated potassium channel